jgi:transposase-like protein
MDLQSYVKSLSQAQRLDLFKVLQYEIEVPKFDVLNSNPKNKSKVECPNCDKSHVVGHGTYKGRSRFLCKSCDVSFNDYTGTVLSGIKKIDQFQSYLKLVLESVTIRKAAEKLLLINKLKI